MNSSIDTLLAHAERQRDEALAAMLVAEEAARRLRAQTAQLLTYRDEYRQRGPAGSGRSTSIEVLRCHQDFMQRLEQALTQQQDALQRAELHAARMRAELLAQELRVASVRKLLQRRGAEQQRALIRLDQRRSDEAAMQQHWRQRGDAAAAGH